MKVTKSQLNQIIKEELSIVDEGALDWLKGKSVPSKARWGKDLTKAVHDYAAQIANDIEKRLGYGPKTGWKSGYGAGGENAWDNFESMYEYYKDYTSRPVSRKWFVDTLSPQMDQAIKRLEERISKTADHIAAKKGWAQAERAEALAKYEAAAAAATRSAQAKMDATIARAQTAVEPPGWWKPGRGPSESKMKITKTQLKQIIKEELSKLLNENNGPLQVNLLNWNNEYDQTAWFLNVNGKEMRTMTSGGSDDVESEADWIADGVISELFDDDEEHGDVHAKVKQMLMQNPEFADAVAAASAAVEQYVAGEYAEY